MPKCQTTGNAAMDARVTSLEPAVKELDRLTCRLLFNGCWRKCSRWNHVSHKDHLGLHFNQVGHLEEEKDGRKSGVVRKVQTTPVEWLCFDGSDHGGQISPQGQADFFGIIIGPAYLWDCCRSSLHLRLS